MIEIQDVRIRQGASFEVTFTDTDLTADTLTITISDENGAVVDTVTASYAVVDDKTVATISLDADYPIGDYNYMYTIVYTDGFEVKLPNPDECDEAPCELPLFTVCIANDIVGS